MISTDTSANVIQRSLPPQAVSAAFRHPRSAALLCLCGYLTLSAIVLATHSRMGLVLAHGCVAGVALWSIGGHRGFRGLVGDLLPLVAAPLLYTEVPALISAMASVYHDALVQQWEQALFGAQPAHTLASAMPWTVVSEILHAGYLAYYPLIFLPPLLLLARGERRGLAETVLALTITCLLCWSVFAFWPVQGPRYLWVAPEHIPNGPFRRLAVALLAAGSSRGAAFPSSHMAVSTVQTVLAWRWQRASARAVVTLVTLLVGLGAVYGGFHYGIDIIAGAAVGLAIGLAILTVYGGQRNTE